ncbi:sodium/glucose cotransporter 5 [Octopus sinensis]|uniref:Sodium/glucose cotransporter 5 n=1 Tax=Octopus sinensis TaxID=2607531 RepID=A0A6P7TC57_9MOLL|nr:sodium/glucose cotransporter 5 [Octopus sinensis]
MAENTIQGTQLHWGDIVVIVVYFVIVIVAGILASCRNRGSIRGYFLAGRNMHWIPVGASLFASNIGSGHFVGLAGSGAATGIGIAAFELNAIFILILLAWVFVPVYISAGVYTMPEYINKRFGGRRIHTYLSCLALLLYVFTKISADLYSGALFITLAADMNIYLAVLILLVISALFTIGGGLTAVIWTDFVQTLVMVIGAFILMVMSFIEVGGYEELVDRYFQAWSNTTRDNLFNVSSPMHKYAECGIPPKNSMSLLRSYDDPNLPWPGVMFGLTVSAVWYWCTDQVIVQRSLAAKNMTHSKGGAILAGYLKFLPLWLIVFPGMIARILFPNEVACVDPDECEQICNSRTGCTNIAYPKLVLKIMPNGLKGLMLAVMMSALISSLTSIFNSSSTIFTMDIWKQIRPKASDRELMIVGRVAVLCLAAVSIVWIPIVQNVPQMFNYIQSVTSYLAPPVCAIFVLGVFWQRTNELGAFVGLMSGLFIGLLRFIWEFSYTNVPCGEVGSRPSIITDVHYLHFGLILFGIVTFITVCVSLISKPIPKHQLHNLTYWTRNWKPLSKASSVYTVPSKSESMSTVASKSESAHAVAEKSERPTIEEKPPAKWYVTAFNWICGIEKLDQQPEELTEAEKFQLHLKMTDIGEKSNWKKFTNINAIILIVLATFLWGFYH